MLPILLTCLFILLSGVQKTDAQSCATPTGLDAINITETTVSLVWDADTTVQTWTLKGRAFPFGQVVTLTLPGSQTQFDVINLTPLQGYEWNLKATCVTGAMSATSASDTFFMDGCTAPDSLWTDSITSTTARLNWTPRPNAFSYNVFGRRVGTTPLAVTIVHAPASSLHLPPILSPNTSYEWLIVTVCTANGAIISFPSAPNTFTTLPSAPQKNAAELNVIPGIDGMMAYPNPASHGQVSVYFSNPEAASYDITITDMNGRLIRHHSNFTGETLQIETTGLQAGMYLIEARGDRLMRTRLVVN